MDMSKLARHSQDMLRRAVSKELESLADIPMHTRHASLDEMLAQDRESASLFDARTALFDEHGHARTYSPGFTPSDYQKAFFNWVEYGTGHCVLEAVAGSGKTTTLLEAIPLMSGRVWLGVFNKKMGNELKSKISKRPIIKDRAFPKEAVFTSTFHAAGFGAVNKVYGRPLVDGAKCTKIARRLVDAALDAGDEEYAKELRLALHSATKLVSIAKNRLLTDESSDNDWQYTMSHYDVIGFDDKCNPSIVMDFAQRILAESRNEKTVIDFDDMIYLPVVENMFVYKHDWVLIDEAQDTNPARRALAKKLLARNGRLVAIGDPHQAIYGFTGADNDALDQIRSRYNATTLMLSVTYRCPRIITLHAQNWVSHIEPHPSAPEGDIASMDEEEMVDIIKSTPKSEHRGIALLCRFNKHLVRLCYSFIKAGVPARIEGRAIGEGLITLAKKWKSRNIEHLTYKLEEYKEREMTKALAKDEEDKAARIEDQVDSLLCIIGMCEGSTIADLISTIESLFGDNTEKSGILTLCSIHKSKGLEWDTVYLLGREQLQPAPWARQEWQAAQEINLIYVAVTRAQGRLVEVTLDID